jgi:hypothetical protein
MQEVAIHPRMLVGPPFPDFARDDTAGGDQMLHVAAEAGGAGDKPGEFLIVQSLLCTASSLLFWPEYWLEQPLLIYQIIRYARRQSLTVGMGTGRQRFLFADTNQRSGSFQENFNFSFWKIWADRNRFALITGDRPVASNFWLPHHGHLAVNLYVMNLRPVDYIFHGHLDNLQSICHTGAAMMRCAKFLSAFSQKS